MKQYFQSTRDFPCSIELGPEELGDGPMSDCIVFLMDVVTVERWKGLDTVPSVAIYMTNGRCVFCRGPHQEAVWRFFTGGDPDIKESQQV